MKLSSKIKFRKTVLTNPGVVYCGPCGDMVGYALPGPPGCAA